MSWHYLREREVVLSEEKDLGGKQSVPSKLTNMQEVSCCLDKKMEVCRGSQYGTTLEHLTESHGREKSVSSLGVFHVKILVAQETEKELMVRNLGYGVNLPESFAKYDHVSCLWKTHQTLLFGDLEEFSQTWPRWGTMQDGACFHLPILEHATSEKGCGYLPTPSASGPGGSWNGKKWKRLNESEKLNRMEAWPPLLEIMMGWPIGWTEKDV